MNNEFHNHLKHYVYICAAICIHMCNNSLSCNTHKCSMWHIHKCGKYVYGQYIKFAGMHNMFCTYTDTKGLYLMKTYDHIYLVLAEKITRMRRLHWDKGLNLVWTRFDLSAVKTPVVSLNKSFCWKPTWPNIPWSVARVRSWGASTVWTDAARPSWRLAVSECWQHCK